MIEGVCDTILDAIVDCGLHHRKFQNLWGKVNHVVSGVQYVWCLSQHKAQDDNIFEHLFYL